MQESPFDRPHRPLCWYEWVLILIGLAWLADAHAAQVYKCTDAQGAVAYQDSPCPSSQQAAPVDIVPAPKPAVSPDYGLDRDGVGARTPRVARDRLPARGRGVAAASSYECRAADGQVFYRHTHCPHSVAAANRFSSQEKSRATARTVSVTAYRVSREEACSQMRRASAIGRSGHRYDEDVSTYDKNLGRDPCH